MATEDKDSTEEQSSGAGASQVQPGFPLAAQSSASTEKLSQAISAEQFEQWYREHEYAQNIREGTPYFNQPGGILPATRHRPSGFLTCHRKAIYERANAPEETSDPKGIFWIGENFEEEIILPFLEEWVVGKNEYVTNSIWIDFEVESDAGNLRIKGATDPVIVDTDSIPLLPLEIKTKRSVDGLDSPNKHHRAQIHAYLKGLSERYDCQITEGIILYAARTDFNVRAFRIEFDPWFWRNTVLDWAQEQTTYRLNEGLPDADPEFGWECEHCPYKMRCGEGSTRYTDTGRTGLLPLFTGYPREKLVEYLTAHEESKLTPSLAHHYPTIAAEYGVFDWHCDCGASHAWDAVDWDGDVTSPPKCPRCSEGGDIRLLAGPSPSDQPPTEVGDVGE